MISYHGVSWVYFSYCNHDPLILKHHSLTEFLVTGERIQRQKASLQLCSLPSSSCSRAPWTPTGCAAWQDAEELPERPAHQAGKEMIWDDPKMTRKPRTDEKPREANHGKHTKIFRKRDIWACLSIFSSWIGRLEEKDLVGFKEDGGLLTELAPYSSFSLCRKLVKLPVFARISSRSSEMKRRRLGECTPSFVRLQEMIIRIITH